MAESHSYVAYDERRIGQRKRRIRMNEIPYADPGDPINVLQSQMIGLVRIVPEFTHEFRFAFFSFAHDCRRHRVAEYH